MMNATREMTLHETTCSVSVRENIELSTFASLGFDKPMIEEAKLPIYKLNYSLFSSFSLEG